MYALRIVSGPAAGRSADIDREIVVGREGGDLDIGDAQLSRRHARIARSGQTVIVEDLGSLNGTFVNGARITEPTPLSPADTLAVGSSQLRLELVADPAAAPAAPVAAAQGTRISDVPPVAASQGTRISDVPPATAAQGTRISETPGTASQGTRISGVPPAAAAQGTRISDVPVTASQGTRISDVPPAAVEPAGGDPTSEPPAGGAPPARGSNRPAGASRRPPRGALLAGAAILLLGIGVGVGLLVAPEKTKVKYRTVAASAPAQSSAAPAQPVTAKYVGAGFLSPVSPQNGSLLPSGTASRDLGNGVVMGVSVKGHPFTVLGQVTMQPGAETGWHIHPNGLDGFILVSAGKITMYQANDPSCSPHTLSPGQSAFISGEAPHDIRNEGKVPAVIFALSFFGHPVATNNAFIPQQKPANCRY